MNCISNHRIRVVDAKDRNIVKRCMIGDAETNIIRAILDIVERYDGR